MCEFDARERDMAILRAHAPFVSPPPVRLSLLPAWPERHVRHALRLPALLAARAGLLQLHDAEHDAFSKYEATPMPSAPGPRAPHIRQAAGAALPPRVCPRAQRRSLAETPLSVLRARPHTPHRGCATPTDASIPRPFHNRIHPFPRLPPQPQLPFAPLPACAALAVAVLHRPPRATTTETVPLRSPGCRRRRSTSTRPTPCLRTLGARRAAPPACAVLDAVRI
ncbi:hypothetical protein B0H14DRAFT_3876736 [Mycena olivaceomarginata]|nr:hypothetical protein B0H14DRAFT_3876736 [Mycena olivaceomarginata]